MTQVPQTPYTAALEGRDPLDAMHDALAGVRSLAAGWTAAHFERSYAPGKWTTRQIITHLAQSELAFGLRVRMALTTPGYIVQPFDQDHWLAREPSDGREALDALAGLGAMNLAFYRSLSPDDRATVVTHPEKGRISVDWIIYQSAGHLVHHLRQLQSLR